MTGADHNRTKIQEVATWMLDNVGSNSFGEIRVTLKIHDGLIVGIEQGTAAKIKVEQP